MTNKAMIDFGLPAGRYPAEVTTVELVTPTRRHPWRLRVAAAVDRNGKEVAAFRDLAKNGDDPYAVTQEQRKSLRAFAERLGTQTSGPVEEIIAGIRELAGTTISAHVKASPVGLAVTLHRNGIHPDPGAKVAAGETLEQLPKPDPEYRQKTLDAQGAHEQLLAGLHHAHRGFTLVAQACRQLRKDDGWVAIGYDSISEYLGSPEISMKRSQFYAFADIWEWYVEKGGVDEKRLCAPSKLEVPLPALKAGRVTAEEAVADAEALGLRDLREKYRDDDDQAPAGDDDPNDDRGSTLQFPLSCAACGVLIEDEGGVVETAGVVYGGHRWPEAWAHDQILAAVAAAERAAGTTQSQGELL